MSVGRAGSGGPGGTRGRAAEPPPPRGQARRAPGDRAAEAQHARGELTARERIEPLLGPGSFEKAGQLRRRRAAGFGPEANGPYTDGVITGWGTAGGRTVFVRAHGFRISGGTPGEARAPEIHRITGMAVSAGAPPVPLDDGEGARVREGVFAFAGHGGTFRSSPRACGAVPRTGVMPGPCAGGAARRFVRTRDASGLPIVTLPCVPGFLPGVDQEHGGIIGHGAKWPHTYRSATAPRISLVLRKAYGGAHTVTDGRSTGADPACARPAGEIAAAGDERAAGAGDPEALHRHMAKEHRTEPTHPYYAAGRGPADGVIDPAGTRGALIAALAALRSKHAGLPSRRHGDPPQ
ncbi:carboxyl transferase domain-containing protein [Streptomyces sp. NPDC002540]